jgi:hypothetical protein
LFLTAEALCGLRDLFTPFDIQTGRMMNKLLAAPAVATALLAAMLGMAPAHADATDYLNCVATSLETRVDNSWMPLGQIADRDLHAGVSSQAEIAALERRGLAPRVATAIVECVMKTPV